MENKDKFADEMLTDDEFNGVVGGTYYQTAEDSEVLYKLGLLSRSYTSKEISSHDREREVSNAFFKLGIMMAYYRGYSFNNDSNHYVFGNQEITQEEAWEIAESQAKKLKLGIYSE